MSRSPGAVRADRVRPVSQRREHATAIRELRRRILRKLPAWHDPPVLLELARYAPDSHHWRGHEGLHLVYDDPNRGVLGRLSVFVSRKGSTRGSFGGFDAVNDSRIARLLFRAGEDWLAERGVMTVSGPVTFSMHEEVGMLARGFESPPALMMPYNPPWYPLLLEACGYATQRSFRTFRYDLARHLRVVVSSPGPTPGPGSGSGTGTGPSGPAGSVKVRSFDPTRLDAECDGLLDVYNAAFAGNWGFTPLSPRGCRHMVDEFLAIGDPLLVRVAEVGGRPVGFLLCLPDVNEVFRTFRALPDLGKLAAAALWIKAGWLRNCRVVTLAVHPDFQGRGLSRAMISSLADEAARAGYGNAELSYVDTANSPMDHLMAGYGFGNEKEYRIYGKSLAPGGGPWPTP